MFDVVYLLIFVYFCMFVLKANRCISNGIGFFC